MPLVTSQGMLRAARRGGYAVVGCTADTLECVDGALAAASELKSPIILMTGQGTLAHSEMETYAAMIQAAARAADVPVALHLDHGRNYEQVIRALRCGYTSVMYDGSALPFDENVETTRAVVRAAHAVGVPVEGELGGIGRWGASDALDLTDPEEAEAFVAATGVDALAVAVGSTHAAYGQSIALDMERLEAIGRRVAVPLVLHGGTGVREEDLAAAARAGISKFNVATQWRRGWIDHARARLSSDLELNDWFTLMGELKGVVKEVVKAKITQLGSAGHATAAG